MDEKIIAVQRMQDLIEKHMDDTITAAELAEVSHFSPWYAQRLFRKYTGYAPADYIRRLRLSRSARQLKTGCVRVIDAALDAGFDSADGYTRAFHREFGCNPGEYAKHPFPIPLFIPYGVKYREKKEEGSQMGNVQNIFVNVCHKPARRIVLKRGIRAQHYMEYCEEVGCEVWGLLTSMDSIDGEPVCLWLPEKYRKPGTSVYVQGVEQLPDAEKIIPEGFDVIELPESDYLCFTGEPFREEDYEDAIRSVWEAMAGFDPTRFGFVWDDDLPRIQLEPRGERGYIELRGVKKA